MSRLPGLQQRVWLALGRPMQVMARLLLLLHRTSRPVQLAALPLSLPLGMHAPAQTADMTGATFSASLIIIVFALMCLVLTTLYTSATSKPHGQGRAG